MVLAHKPFETVYYTSAFLSLLYAHAAVDILDNIIKQGSINSAFSTKY